jgi:hypothetical protein
MLGQLSQIKHSNQVLSLEFQVCSKLKLVEFNKNLSFSPFVKLSNDNLIIIVLFTIKFDYILEKLKHQNGD